MTSRETQEWRLMENYAGVRNCMQTYESLWIVECSEVEQKPFLTHY